MNPDLLLWDRTFDGHVANRIRITYQDLASALSYYRCRVRTSEITFVYVKWHISLLPPVGTIIRTTYYPTFSKIEPLRHEVNFYISSGIL